MSDLVKRLRMPSIPTYRKDLDDAANEIELLQAERDALLTAAEHGLSLMLAGRLDEQGNPIGPLRLYHRCEGCESALRLLQSMGKYPGAQPADDAALKEPNE